MDEAHVIAPIVDRLCEQYPMLPKVTIERLTRTEFERYRDASVTTFVPILLARAVEGRLKQVEHVLVEIDVTEPQPTVPRTA